MSLKCLHKIMQFDIKLMRILYFFNCKNTWIINMNWKKYHCSGNWEKKLGRPYRRGKPCSRCTKSCRLGKLCTNACNYADQWSNCKELMAYGKAWLCATETQEGTMRSDSCRATCNCRNKIHEWRWSLKNILK